MGQALPRRAILIVDDEPFIRHDLLDFFEDRGFTVFDAESADDAIQLLEQNREIQIVITDIQMPGSMDGMALAHHIRKRYPPTLLIIASGALRPAASELPDNAMFVGKPLDPRDLLRHIEQNSAH